MLNMLNIQPSSSLLKISPSELVENNSLSGATHIYLDHFEVQRISRNNDTITTISKSIIELHPEHIHNTYIYTNINTYS